MKEDQYNKIIAALKKTAEENNQKKEHQNGTAETRTSNHNPNAGDWKDTLDELNNKKEEVNHL